MKAFVRAVIALVVAVSGLTVAEASAPEPAFGAVLPFELFLPVAWGTTVRAGGPHPYAGGSTGVRNSVDLGNGTALSVHAAAGGTAFVESSCTVRIDHADGWQTRYTHLINVDRSINGKGVAPGQRIGNAGHPGQDTCGTGTFRHVHMGLYRHGQAVAIDATSIGGYTVRQTGGSYCGYWTRNSDGAIVADARSVCAATGSVANNQRQPTTTTPPPDPDADGDGVPDRVDSCTNDHGDATALGCPLEVGDPVDLNGDGRADAVHRWSGGVNSWISRGDGTYTITGHTAQAGYGYNDGTWLTGDTNGDTKTDLIHIWRGGVNTWTSRGDGTYTITGHTAQAGYGYNDGTWLTPACCAVRRYRPFGSWPGFVDRQYRDFAGRAPTAAELSADAEDLTAGRTTPAAFIASLMGRAWYFSPLAPVTRLYQAYFLRTPEFGGLTYWADQRRRGKSLNEISRFFAGSREFRTRYGTLTNRQFVERIYQNVLGRPGERAGIDFWSAELGARRRDRGSVMIGFSESAEYKSKTKAQVDVILTYAGMLRRSPTTAELDADKSKPLPTVIDTIRLSPPYAAR